LYGRYKTSGPVKVQIKAEVLGAPLEQTVAVTLPAKDNSNPEIERMWASHRVERLMADDRADGSKGRFAEIVRLCEGYSIASQYASFIVLENDAEYQRWKIERRNATRVERDRAAQVAVRERLDQLRRETAEQVGPRPADKVTANNASTRSEPIQLARQDQPVAAPANQPRDLNLGIRSQPGPSTGGGRSGGGAIDPLTALAAASLAGLGWALRRKRGANGSLIDV
jgi:hypothetical protein